MLCSFITLSLQKYIIFYPTTWIMFPSRLSRWILRLLVNLPCFAAWSWWWLHVFAGWCRRYSGNWYDNSCFSYSLQSLEFKLIMTSSLFLYLWMLHSFNMEIQINYASLWLKQKRLERIWWYAILLFFQNTVKMLKGIYLFN